MQLRNTRDRYGWVGIGFHWLVAVTVFSLFGLGLYMVSLSYYDPLYKVLPDWHRSIGLTLALIVVLRLLWRWWTTAPEPHPGHAPWEKRLAAVAHLFLYVLIFGMIISGYLISTAEGQGIDVFGWFKMPAITGEIEGMEDVAGVIHYWIAWSLMGLAGLHAAAALKHHFLDKDNTLIRILKPGPGVKAR